MRTRAKALFVTAAMVTTFAILPTFGAAADPLADATYDVGVGESIYTLTVINGVPTPTAVEGVEFLFTYDEETGRVLDDIDVLIDDVIHDATVTEAAETGTDEEPTEGTEDDEDNGEGTAGASTEDGVLQGESTEGESTDDLIVEDVEEEDAEDEADSAHGALVSTVAQCAPKGREAREAGLPNHGFFVRAAAHGEDVEFEVDGVTKSAALSTQEGADAFCVVVEELLATDEAPAEEGSEGDATAEGAEADTSTEGEDAPQVESAETDEVENSRGSEAKETAADRGKGRANAPGQQKKNG